MRVSYPTKAISLRKFLRRRAAGKRHPEHLLHGCAYHGPLDGDVALRRIRRPEQPWCPILGPDSSIRDDVALQTMFAAWAALGPDYEQAQFEAMARRSRTRWQASQTLQRLQTEGRQLLDVAERKRKAIQRRQPSSSHDSPLGGLFAPKMQQVP